MGDPSGKVAIIVGIDGAGKSTVLRRLTGLQTSHWRMLRHVNSQWSDRVDKAAETMSKLRGRERTAFILALIEGEWNACIAPNLAAGRDVVCDGFYLRPLVKEMVFEDGDVDAVTKASPLSGEELVVVVDVPVDVALRRKHGHEISGYECFTSPADFAEFQASQREQLLEVVSTWNHVIVDGTQSEQDVAAEVETVLANNGIFPLDVRDEPTPTRAAHDRATARA
jgi:thymidylate kinase